MSIVVNRKEFYVINVSNRNVMLSDLYICISKHASVNLLSKHYHFTLEELIKSATNGSLYKKRNKIWLRNGELRKELDRVNLGRDNLLKSRSKSSFVFKPVIYEELLDVSDDEYIEELIDDEHRATETK